MCLSDFSGCNLIGLSSSLAITLSENLSAGDTAILAAFITALGDNLAILATTKSNEENKDDISKNSNNNTCIN